MEDENDNDKNAESEDVGYSILRHVDIDPQEVSVPWRDEQKVKPLARNLTVLKEFLDKYEKEDIAGHLGDVVKQLIILTPSLSNCLADEENPEVFEKFQNLFRVLFEEPALDRAVVAACDALTEVIKSKNPHCKIFVTTINVDQASFMRLLVKIYLYRTLEAAAAAQKCMMAFLSGPFTWFNSCVRLFQEEEDIPNDFYANLNIEVMETKHNKRLVRILWAATVGEMKPYPAKTVERISFMTQWINFLYYAIQINKFISEREFETLDNIDQTVTHYRECYRCFDELLQYFEKYDLDDFVNVSFLYFILERCNVLNLIIHFIYLRGEEGSKDCNLPYITFFLDRVLKEEYGFLLFITMRNSAYIENRINEIKKQELQYTKASFFDEFMESHPSAGRMVDLVQFGLKYYKLYHVLCQYRDKPYHAVEDPFVLAELEQLPTVTPAGVVHVKLKLVSVILDLLNVPPKIGRPTAYLQILLHFLRRILDCSPEPEFWSEICDKLFRVLRRSFLKDALKSLEPGIPSIFFARKYMFDETGHKKIVLILDEAIKEFLVEDKLNDGHVAALHVIEALMKIERERYKVLVLEEIVVRKLEKTIERLLRRDLEKAIQFYQRGMNADSPENRLLLRFSSPVLRVLAKIHDVTNKKTVSTSQEDEEEVSSHEDAEEEMSMICSEHIDNLLSLWTINSEQNGQTVPKIGVRIKCEIIQFIKPRMYEIVDKKSIFLWLIYYGSQAPLNYSSLMEILLALLPETLPLLVCKEENVEERLEKHAAEVDRWTDEFLKTDNIPSFGEMLLCSASHVAELIDEFLRRLGTLQNENMEHFVAWSMWNAFRTILSNNADVEVENEREETIPAGLGNATNRLKTCAIENPFFSAALTRVLSIDKETGSVTVPLIFERYSKSGKYNREQQEFQKAINAIIVQLFTNKSSSYLIGTSDVFTCGAGKTLLSAVLNMTLHSKHSVEMVEDNFDTLELIAENTQIGYNMMCELFPQFTGYEIVNRVTKEHKGMAKLLFKLITLVDYFIGEQPAAIRAIIFDPSEEDDEKQLIRLIATSLAALPDPSPYEIIIKVVQLAKDAANLEPVEFIPIPREFVAEEEPEEQPRTQEMRDRGALLIEKRKRLWRRSIDNSKDNEKFDGKMVNIVRDFSQREVSFNPQHATRKRAAPLDPPEEFAWEQ